MVYPPLFSPSLHLLPLLYYTRFEPVLTFIPGPTHRLPPPSRRPRRLPLRPQRTHMGKTTPLHSWLRHHYNIVHLGRRHGAQLHFVSLGAHIPGRRARAV
jgi:hypothetical protein